MRDFQNPSLNDNQYVILMCVNNQFRVNIHNKQNYYEEY